MQSNQPQANPEAEFGPATTLGEIVAARPETAGLFEALRLDYCCGGGETLERACEDGGLDAATVLIMLNAQRRPQEDGVAEAHDVAGLPTGELCEHIVEEHHAGLRRLLPRIADLLDTVVRVHGRERPSLADLRERFTALRGELEGHLDLEEAKLFPACRALESDAGAAPGRFDIELLDRHLREHDDTGAALRELRGLAGDYETETPLCATHQALLRSLLELERDLHQHVHEENNILFPRVRSLAGAVPAAG